MDFNNGGRPVVLTPSGTTTNRTPTISWSAVTGADSYQVMIVRADTSSSVLYVQNLKSTTFTPTSELAPRQYRVWVRAVSTTGVVSEWGNLVNITITSLDAPKLETIVVTEPVMPSPLQDLASPLELADVAADAVSMTADSLNADESPLPVEEVAVAPENEDRIDVVMTRWALGIF
jgi:hypothetical protein